MKMNSKIAMDILLLVCVCLLFPCTLVYGQPFHSINIIDHIIDIAIVNQSSIYPKGNIQEHGYYNASKAIDGKNCTNLKKKCCSVTDEKYTSLSWWQIDLIGRFTVETVEIYGRTFIGANHNDNSQLKNATIFAGNTSLIQNTKPGIKIFSIPNSINTTHFIHKMDIPITAQYFYVQISNNILTICEFILHGKANNCQSGQFGQQCQNNCQCADEKECDILTGKCKSPGCLPGWTGHSCNKVCPHRKFERECEKECHCSNNSSCNNVNGSCNIGSCEPGWLGHSCDEKCHSKSFGINCSRPCHCYKSECNHINGECETDHCDPGWHGKTCSEKCGSRTYGHNCSKHCFCFDNTSCDHVNGTCYQRTCESGWKGLACNIPCPKRRFGQNCANTCHCSNNTDCDKRNGTCSSGSCEKNYQGNDCSLYNQYIPSKSDKNSSGPIIGGTVSGVVLFVIGVMAFFIVYKRWKSSENAGGKLQFTQLDSANKKQRPLSNMQQISKAEIKEDIDIEEKQNENGTGGQDDYYSFGGQYMKVQIHELWDYIHENMKNRCEGFNKEFQSLPKGLVESCKVANSVSNRGKNRYKEMFAYDDTRVILENIDDSKDGTQTNYINASYIDGYEKVKKFVASQGPTKQMIDDFWRMIWQLKSDKIVMLTDLVERGTVKCLQYWPNGDEDECQYGNIVVKILETTTYLDYNIRYLEARKNGETSRRIRQFHFKSWPDKDVPDSTWCLVNFWRVVDTNAASSDGPIIVHCSAGVGRTGTFIALDNIANQAQIEGCVRPFQIVETLRRQRVNMVQTQEQYVYLHEAVADTLLFGTHIVLAKQFEEIYKYMLEKGHDNTRTRLLIQFELIEKSMAYSKLDADDSHAYSNVKTMLSTEDEQILPKGQNKLSKKTAPLGALHLPNYKGKSTYLVTMSPNKDNLEVLWSLVEGNNIKTIINLSEDPSTLYKKKESQKAVKQFEYIAWKDGSQVPVDTQSLLKMIDNVMNWQPHLPESQPVLILSGNGHTRSGVVCVLLNELHRMKYEGHINIVESVKMMKKRNRQLIGSYEQYKCCFDLIMSQIQSTQVYQNI